VLYVLETGDREGNPSECDIGKKRRGGNLCTHPAGKEKKDDNTINLKADPLENFPPSGRRLSFRGKKKKGEDHKRPKDNRKKKEKVFFRERKKTHVVLTKRNKKITEGWKSPPCHLKGTRGAPTKLKKKKQSTVCARIENIPLIIFVQKVQKTPPFQTGRKRAQKRNRKGGGTSRPQAKKKKKKNKKKKEKFQKKQQEKDLENLEKKRKGNPPYIRTKAPPNGALEDPRTSGKKNARSDLKTRQKRKKKKESKEKKTT